MNGTQFIRIHNKVINVGAIDYVEFLDSGRSMIFMRGLTQEKQNIPVDEAETRRLRAVLDGMLIGDPTSAAGSNPVWPASVPPLSNTAFRR